MWILSFRTVNHPVIGTQILNFKNKNSDPLGMIVFAGENGTGKSTVIEIINSICKLSAPTKMETGELHEIEILMQTQEFNSLRYPDPNLSYLNEWKKNTPFKIGYSEKLGQKAKSFYIEYQTNDGKIINKNCLSFYGSENAKRILGTIYMDHDLHRKKGRSKFDLKLTKKVWSGRRSSQQNDFHTQEALFQAYTSFFDALTLRTFIDRQTSTGEENVTSSDLATQEQNSKDIPLAKLPINIAIKILDTGLEVVGVDQNFRIPIITKFAKKVNFSALSSGEKQILGIIAFLTYDIDGDANGAPILIDEPENSLHPNLQKKIRPFFSRLFNQKNQVFLVTHSPFIIHENGPAFTEKTFIFSRHHSAITITDSGEFYHADSVRIINDAFKLDHFVHDARKTPFMLVEGETDEMYWNAVKRIFFNDLDLKIKWIGNYVDNTAHFTGISALNKAGEFLFHRPEICSKKIIILHDCDSNVKEVQNAGLWITKLSNVAQRRYSIGIENSLFLPSDFDYEKFYREKKKTDAYGAQNVIRELDKKRLAQYILLLDEAKQKEIFESLQKYLVVIAQWLNAT